MSGVMTEEEAQEHRSWALYSFVQSCGLDRTRPLSRDDQIAFGVISSSELMAVLTFMGIRRDPSSKASAPILLGSGQPIFGPLRSYRAMQSLARDFPRARDTLRERDDGK